MRPPLSSVEGTIKKESFTLVDVETLRKAVTQLKPSACSFDPISTYLF